MARAPDSLPLLFTFDEHCPLAVTHDESNKAYLSLKARARKEGGQIAVFFIDDNFAINVKRTKSLLRAIIAAKAQLFWVAQVSANLLRDEELVDLMAASGAKWQEQFVDYAFIRAEANRVAEESGDRTELAAVRAASSRFNRHDAKCSPILPDVLEQRAHQFRNEIELGEIKSVPRNRSDPTPEN